MKLKLKITSPEQTLYENEVWEVIVPTNTGNRAILPHHTPHIFILKPGVVKLRHQKTDVQYSDYYAVGDGIVTIRKDSVQLLVSTAEHADSIDKLRAMEALKQAEEAARNTADHFHLAQAAALIERNTARIAVARAARTK